MPAFDHIGSPSIPGDQSYDSRFATLGALAVAVLIMSATCEAAASAKASEGFAAGPTAVAATAAPQASLSQSRNTEPAELLGAAPPAAPGAPTITQVMDNVRNWLIGLLSGLATLFVTVGGLRYLMAGGNEGEVMKAKGALKSAACGYGLAALAPVLVGVLKSVVGV